MDRISDALERARENAIPVGAIRSNRVTRLREEIPESPVPETPAGIRYTQTRTVHIAPEVLREHRLVDGFGAGNYRDSYKILCTQVLQRLRENDWNALAVTSPAGGEGKTLTAINLAISLSHEVDCTVLLVDADLRAPGIHRCFGLPAGPGLGDYLTARVALADVLVHPGIDRLVLLPGGTPLANSSEMLGSQRMMNLVQELKGRYPSRIIVFDLPPVLSAADALAFSPYVDAAVLVVEEGASDREQVQRAAEMLGSTRLLGTVLNKSRQARSVDSTRRPGWLARLLRRGKDRTRHV
ncbi:MAG: CpsD/CapB family tyrosine-protein kinase [Betaproteobacteria bacterium]